MGFFLTIYYLQYILNFFLTTTANIQIIFQIEDPEDNWTTAEPNLTTSTAGNVPPPAKKKKYKSFEIALENISDGGNNG